ncbi:MAG: adenylosuccinate synthetase, partial [Muribaculaceae bacterium]|nr:adenylosuccinate synthetase [Muribaculaceae bacterium]
ACTAYKVDGKLTDRLPFDIATVNIEPVYEELPGWQTPMTAIRSEEEFPEQFRAYIDFLEKHLGVPIAIVSVGPDRTQTIERH